MTLQGCHYRHASIMVILIGLVLASVSGRALALSPADLIIVYNRTLPDSQAVASYYAQKRQVPPANLVGVEVPPGEDMSRADYDNKLVPPIRAMVDKQKAAGRAAAILLVYGIPLRVGAVALTKADQELKTLAAAEVIKNQELCLQLVQKVDRLMGAATKTPPANLTYPPLEVLNRAQATFTRGMEYLDKTAATPAVNRAEMTSLLVKLGGVSPEAYALMKRMARAQGRKRRQLQPQELLGLQDLMRQEVQDEQFRGILPSNARDLAAAVRFKNGLMGELLFWYQAGKVYAQPQSLAAVDSELTMIMAGPYQRVGWLPNPFNVRFDRMPGIAGARARTLPVSRLDGTTPAIARRLVDDALETERVGLRGVFYIDARGLTGPAQYGNYVWYDRHLLHLYDVVKKYSGMKSVLNKQPALFPPGACPDAALYCGWYALGNYVPAFEWQKGAVGYHVASSEATTLKKPDSRVWCKRMLEMGVAATLGPVTEPYLASFPLPDQFFPLLMTGRVTLLEVYFCTVPQVSWMQVLIGDPLYRPFLQNPAIRLDQLSKHPPLKE